MNEVLYIWFRRAAIKEYTEEYTRKIMERQGLCYRTVTALTRIINNESGITRYDIETLSNPDFYTMENMLKVAEQGLLDIIPYRFFENEEFLTKSGITKLPDGFLAGNREIDEFTVMPQITEIGDDAFYRCIRLKTVNFLSPATRIGARAFKDCINYVTEGIPDSVTYVGSGAYKNCVSIKKFRMSKNVHQIRERTFQNCSGMEEFYAEDGICIGDRAFYGCISLTEMPAVIGELGDESFKDCKNIKEIKLRVALVPRRTFYDCINLEVVSFLGGSVPGKIKKDAFFGCDSLLQVLVDGFSYQLREADGYRELTKNFYIVNRKSKRVLSCDTIYSRKVGSVLNTAGCTGAEG